MPEKFSLEENITPENLENVEMEKIALDRERFGTLTFDSILSRLNELKDIFVDFQRFGYRELLTDSIASQVDQLFSQFLEKINWLRTFNPASSGNVTGDKQAFEQQIQDLYTQAFNQIVPALNHLRYRAISKNPKQQELAKLQLEAGNARAEYQKITEELRNKINELESQKQQVENTSGEIAARTTGKYFEAQAKTHAEEKNKWASQRATFFYILLGLILANIILFFVLYIWGDVLNKISIKTTSIFTIPYGVLKIAMVSVLSYAVSFASRNYRINAHLESVNKHRKNVAETLNKYLEAGPSPEDKTIMLQQGVSAMFQHLSTGYDDGNDAKSDDGPVKEIVKFIPTIKGPSV